MNLSSAALGAAAAGLLLLALAGPSYRVGASLETAFSLLRWGGYVGLFAVVFGIVAAALAYRRRQRGAVAVGAVAVVAGLVAAVVPFMWQQRAGSVPPIHDISTDLENPPLFDAVVPLRAEAPNSLDRPPILAQQQREGYPDLAPITLSAPPAQAFDRALAIAQEKGWEIVSADKSSGRIEATDTTTWFGFQDDVVVRLTPWGAGTRVDVRSVSRVGRSDVGTNARRIEDFLGSLEE
jgi:uncharacterized protein (DUF1499 family)